MKRVSDEDLKYIKETGITLGIDSQKALAKELLELRSENERLKMTLNEFEYIGWSSARNKKYFQYNGPDPVELDKSIGSGRDET